MIALVFLAGCGVQRTPDSYTSSVGKNFVKSCEAEGRAGSPPLSDPSKVCNCAYNQIKSTIKFSQFKKYNSALAEKPGPLPAELANIVANCTSGATSSTTGSG